MTQDKKGLIVWATLSAGFIAQAIGLAAGLAPTNVTVTPVTPTILRIEWSPSPGAVRYRISRSGAPDTTIEANAGFLQGNRFGYGDIGRRPATLHTYTVTAEFPAPTVAGRSAPVQVLTPPALPPQNFKATASGANAVVLTWTSRPEAALYRIIRNGGNVPAAVVNVTGLTYVDRNLPPARYTYIVHSVIRLAGGEEVTGEFSNPVTINTRPFNIVAIGDSVMWGQGLLAPHKFATRVRDWLAGQLGTPVAPVNWKAHSGAVTYPDPDRATQEDSALDGEVPSDWPTISHQISLASSAAVPDQVPASDVDLVLINGCANNVGIVNVLSPSPDDSALRRDTRAVCGAGMTNVLREAVERFPNAKIIVSGYFPYISTESALDKLLPVMGVVGFVVPPDPLVGGLIFTASYRARVAARSDVFFQESNSSLQSAVDTVNGMPFEGRSRFNQIRLARLNPAPNNSYAGSDSWQWLIPAPPFAQDEVYDHRRSECAKLLPSPTLTCLQASMGHPNVAGAQAYAAAIESVAAQAFLQEWKDEHAGPVVATEDSLAINLRVQPGPSTREGGMILVSASDGPLGPPLQGTVQLNGVPAGRLGTEMRYAFQQTNPTEILARVDVAGRRSRTFSIPVRTQSIAVNLANSGDPRTAVVTATDAVTGELLSGTVRIQSPLQSPPFIGGRLGVVRQPSGPTGQLLTYPSCGQIARFPNLTKASDPAPCVGFVRVPYYPDASFQDVTGALIETVTIQKPGDIVTPSK